MPLQSYAPEQLTIACVRESLAFQRCVILRGVLSPVTAQHAFAAFSRLMSDEARLKSFPLDLRTRLGYTPPGVETLQRGTRKPDFSRAMFDFDPTLTLGEPAIAILYKAAVRCAKFVLALLPESGGVSLAVLPKGSHRLRTARYLLAGTNESDILFHSRLDFSLLTVFLGNGMPGLQIQIGDEWHSPDLKHGDALVGVGTPFTQFHPDIRPLRHRIVGGTDDRISSFLFYELADEVLLPVTGELYGDMLSQVLKDIRVDS